MSDKARIADLESQVRHHNERYYDQDSPEISDVEYDKLKTELQRLSPDSPVFDEIGNPTYGQKHKHGVLMGSLDKCHTAQEIIGKFKGKKLCVMPKIDGLSLTCHYDGGKLVLAATRGNGKEGEMVTPNAMQIENLPGVIPFEGLVEVRGEAVIYSKLFFGVMDQPGYDGLPEGYKSPRASAAGGMRQKDVKKTADRHISFVGYKILDSEGNLMGNFSEQVDTLKKWGFQTCPYELVEIVSPEGVDELLGRIHDTDLPYDTDGVVLVLDDAKAFVDAGMSGKYPKGAMAYKFETEKTSSRVAAIEWNTTRQGRVVPVSIIDPVELGESTVSRATMNNAKWIADEDVSVGDKILIEKGGEIIPHFVKVLERAPVRNSNVPTVCPSCGTPLRMEGVDLVCDGESCPAQFLKFVRHILVKLDVKNIAISTLTKLEERGLLKEPWEIFDISLEKLAKAGFGDGESLVWVKAVTRVKTTPEKLLACMGIACWGERMFELLFKGSNRSPQNWVDLLVRKPECDSDKELDGTLVNQGLREVKGIGPEKTKSLVDGLERGKKVVSELMKRVTVEYPSQDAPGTPLLGGKSFLITGTLSKTRQLVEADIKAAGGVIKGSVSKNLDFLVVGEEPGSKVDKARASGVKMIGEAELYKMIGSGL